jgi:hypothetical protein
MELNHRVEQKRRDLLQGAIEYLGVKADFPSIYKVIENSKKAQKNSHWNEKNKILTINENFTSKESSVWELKIA